MRIKINHIAKMEGHMDFLGHLLNGDVAKAKINTTEGVRLVEGTVSGRIFSDAPIITSRICGVCPVVHNLTAIHAMEEALDVKVNEKVYKLRELLEHGQIIHSHALHFFFLSLPDFLDYDNDVEMAKKYPKETKAAVDVRRFALDMLEIVGGRSCHPISTEVGGFKVLPDKKKLNDLLKRFDNVMEQAGVLVKLFKSLDYPKFTRKTEFLALSEGKKYEILKGNIISTEGLDATPEAFGKKIKEINIPYSMTKRVYRSNKSFFVGALARINNNYKFLNKEAKEIWDSFSYQVPDYNIFHNIPAQVVETVQSLVESKKIIQWYLKDNSKVLKTKYKVKAGKGAAVMEAPRGLLLHYYELDKNGMIKKCNVVSPTVMFLANIEADLKEYLPNLKKMASEERKKKIKTMIRAYDPCISCATH